MVKIDLVKHFGLVKKEFQKALERGMRKALLVLLEELKRLTPEDTKKMLASYRVVWVRQEGDKIIGTIWNDAEYAIYVEYWVKWKAFNYHKPKWSIFYSGVGNKTFARALDNKRQEILDIIARELW